MEWSSNKFPSLSSVFNEKLFSPKAEANVPDAKKDYDLHYIFDTNCKVPHKGVGPYCGRDHIVASPIKFTSDVTILPVMCGSVMVATSIGGRVVWICSNSEDESTSAIMLVHIQMSHWTMEAHMIYTVRGFIPVFNYVFLLLIMTHIHAAPPSLITAVTILWTSCTMACILNSPQWTS